MTTSYADYSYYTGTYLGTAILSADFARLALRASAVIDQLTFGRAADETDVDNVDAIKMAVCVVAEEIQSVEADGGADGISSESIGSNSVTYADNASRKRTKQDRYADATSLYLGGTGLMFPGFLSGEYGGAVDEN